jgi:HTH-type transcriptional regulator / antitoxin HipB
MADLARTPKQLGNAIRNVRKGRGLSQTELGERTGLRQATISQIEAGGGGAKLENILKVLAVLGLELRIDPRSLSSGTRIEDIF